MPERTVSPELAALAAELTPKEQAAAELYVSGPPSCLGSKVASYVSAYTWRGSRAGARSKASALFGRERVAAYVRALRELSLEESAGTLRDWSELAPDAQETLHRAATGSLPRGLSDEEVRSAVRAAMYVIDRAYGTPAQQIELRQSGGIVVHVAGPETLGQVLELHHGAELHHLEELEELEARALPPPSSSQHVEEGAGEP